MISAPTGFLNIARAKPVNQDNDLALKSMQKKTTRPG